MTKCAAVSTWWCPNGCPFEPERRKFPQLSLGATTTLLAHTCTSAACSRGFESPVSPYLQPSKPTWLLSQDIHSQRSRFTKGCAWSMLGAAPKQSPDAGPPAADCTAWRQPNGAYTM